MLPIEQGKDYDNFVKSQLPYRLLENLGYGGSGYVEKVEDILTGKQFARKVIRRRHERRFKEEQTIVFRNEIKNIRRLGGHPHIVSLFATYTTHDEFGLILQPVASDKDLEQYLANYRSAVLAEDPASPDPHVRTMSAVLEQAFGCLATGMSYMHTNKVRHKDVKLQNILIHEGRVVYTDFGCSFDSNGLSRSITDGKPGPMTAKYSAPEVLAHEARDSSSDIYSLGCVFISILSALTSASRPEIQDIWSFADSMDDIHRHIVHWQTSPRTASLPVMITQMTAHDSSKRLCAVHIASKTHRSPGLSCQECAMHPMTPDSECVKIGTCVRGTQDTTQERVSHTPKDADNPSETSAMASQHACRSVKTKASMLSPSIRTSGSAVIGHRSSAMREAVSISDESLANLVEHVPETMDRSTLLQGHLPSGMSMTPNMTPYRDSPTIIMTSDSTGAHDVYADKVISGNLTSSHPTPFSTPPPAEPSPRRVSTFPMMQHNNSAVFHAQETPDNAEPKTFLLGQGRVGLGRSHTTPGASFTNSFITYLGMPKTLAGVPTILVFHEGTFSHCIPVRIYHSCSVRNTEPDQQVYGMFNTANTPSSIRMDSAQAKEVISMLDVDTMSANVPHIYAESHHDPGYAVIASEARVAPKEQHQSANGSAVVQQNVSLHHTQKSTTD
ncbi:kinase-like domain-containing protein [Alternaria rosae]|uniref:kinase-like domain-containing protein n=1 Tax=Alternaria rosae TaxID=1187941 RepID=UPI001E8ED90F|nr:kinase-like domain-containing protein [Alternaria rosae]KAH6865205.1 kinase-like domain-containing protein [Alternaria rosae]